MLRTRTDLLRLALFASLGLIPNACGGRTTDNDSARSRAEGKTENPTDTPQADGGTNSGSPVASTGEAPSPNAPGAFPTPTPNPLNPTPAPVPDPTVMSPTPNTPSPVISTPGTPLPPAPLPTPDITQTPNPQPNPSASPSATPGSSLPECGASEPLLLQGVDTGLERCTTNGVVHRPRQVECPVNLPPRTLPDAGVPPEGTPDPDYTWCNADEDCTFLPLGYCSIDEVVQSCKNGCRTDDDCEAEYVCQCGINVGTCVRSNCHTDDDCADDFVCAQAIAYGSCGETIYRFACQTPDDECRTADDCSSNSDVFPGKYCPLDGSTTRRCADRPPIPPCGRPFIVAGHNRRAPLAQNNGWCARAKHQPLCDTLSTEQRQILGQAWAELGRMEHASIAAFARFVLHLMQLGAPSSLMEQANQALADETQHAKDCFALASAYLEGSVHFSHGVGPGPLAMDGALDTATWFDIVRLCIHEGCVGETVAALEAAEAFEHAQDPAVKTVLGRIRVDEQAHAELAWRFVQWSFQTGDEALRRAITQEFAALTKEANAARPASERTRTGFDTPSFDTLPHGIVPAALRAELRAIALRDVVLPCAQALLGVTVNARNLSRAYAFGADSDTDQRC